MIINQKLTLEHVVVQAEGTVASDMDGEMVMLSVLRGKYYNLGEIGGKIWDCLSSPISVNKLVSILMAEYDVEQRVCEEQVVSFLESLLEEQLIYTGEDRKRY